MIRVCLSAAGIVIVGIVTESLHTTTSTGSSSLLLQLLMQQNYIRVFNKSFSDFSTHDLDLFKDDDETQTFTRYGPLVGVTLANIKFRALLRVVTWRQ